jgi:hypothetical protein
MYLGAMSKPEANGLVFKLSRFKDFDTSGKGNAVANNGVIAATDHNGRSNKAWETATNKNISIADSESLDFTNGITVYFSFNIANGTTNRLILIKGDVGVPTREFSIAITTSNTIRVTIHENGNSTDNYKSYRTNVVFTGKWVNLMFVFYQNSLKIYKSQKDTIETNYIKEADLETNSIYNGDSPMIINGYLNNGTLDNTSAFTFDKLLCYNKPHDISQFRKTYNYWRSH